MKGIKNMEKEGENRPYFDENKKIGKVLLGIWGCMVVGILCYLFRDNSPYNIRIVTAGVGVIIAAVMNFGFWMLEE